MPREEIFAHILRMLKPGGIFGVVDARRSGPGVDERTHRIDVAIVIADLEAAGFELLGESELLAYSDGAAHVFGDDRTNIDRFLLRFQKPAR
jgi:predicted methyltransferase